MHPIQADIRERGARDDRPVLITGGAGFIGANLAQWLLEAGRDVVLFDNLSRAGVADNARALATRYRERVRLVCSTAPPAPPFSSAARYSRAAAMTSRGTPASCATARP